MLTAAPTPALAAKLKTWPSQPFFDGEGLLAGAAGASVMADSLIVFYP
jgi:hypothetical protein